MFSLPTCPDDLVFSVIGGTHYGKSLSIKTQKCILAFDDHENPTRPTRCALLRGKAGVTVRNLDNQILINGERKASHWLKPGDQLEFPNSVILQVSKLGFFETTEQPQIEQTVCAPAIGTLEDISVERQDVPIAPFTPVDSQFQQDVDEVNYDWRTSESSSRFDDQTQRISETVETRFHEIERRLEQLSEQIASLVTIASCGKFSATTLPENEWVAQNALSSMSSSGSIQKCETGGNETTDAKCELAVQASTEQNDLALSFEATLVPVRRGETSTTEYSPHSSDKLTALDSSPRSQPLEHDVPSQPQLTPSQLDIAELAKKFSTLPAGASEESLEATAVESVAAIYASGQTLDESSKGDDAIEALLKRLYESNPQSNPVIEKHEESQSHELHLARNDIEYKSCLPAETPSVDPKLGDSFSYTKMKFGYDLEASDSTIGDSTETDVTNSLNKLKRNDVKDDSRSVSPQSDVSTVAQSLVDVPPMNKDVFDILARLKEENTWETEETTATELTPEAASELMYRLSTEFTTEPTETRQLEAGAEKEILPTAPSHHPDSVEEYMSRLFARMQIGTDDRLDSPSQPKISTRETETEIQTSEPQNHDDGLMTAEEYVPIQKGIKLKSLDTMREIANTTARTAVAFSDLDRCRTRGLMQILISLGAIIMTAYYLLFVSKSNGDTASVIGYICLLIAGGAGYLAFKSFKGATSLADFNPLRRPTGLQ